MATAHPVWATALPATALSTGFLSSEFLARVRATFCTRRDTALACDAVGDACSLFDLIWHRVHPRQINHACIATSRSCSSSLLVQMAAPPSTTTLVASLEQITPGNPCTLQFANGAALLSGAGPSCHPHLPSYATPNRSSHPCFSILKHMKAH